MILDIRGTHGSGKSHLVHQLIDRSEEQHTVMHEDNKIGTYLPKYELALVGFYSRVCGGCDGIKKADDICERVRLCAKASKHVLLEGILVAHTFTRYNNLAVELAEYDYRFCFLNTPFDQCVQHVQERRVRRGKPPEFDMGHITQDFHLISTRVRQRLEDAGRTCVDLEWTNAVDQIIDMLNDWEGC